MSNHFALKENMAEKLFRKQLADGQTSVDESSGKKLLSEFGLKIPVNERVYEFKQAIKFLKSTKTPVVIKAISDNPHKTELGYVFTGIDSAEKLNECWHALMENLVGNNDEFNGVLIEEMILEGSEFIIGVMHDDCFGPVIMLGTGGVFINLLDDVSFRVLPIEKQDAVEMISEIKGSKLLQGYRNQPPLARHKLEECLLGISKLAFETAGLYKSMEFNPIILTSEEAVVADSKIELREKPLAAAINTDVADTENIDKFFLPESVALVGASGNPGKIGYAIADSLLNHEYTGKVYPVTRGGKKIFGHPSYETVLDIPGKIDLAILVVDLFLVPEILKQCHEKGVVAVVLVSGGGKELGGDRQKLEQEIKQLTKEYNIRLLGPNCIGGYNPTNHFDAFFQTYDRMIRPKQGSISIATQSGTYGVAFLEDLENLGVSKMVSYGNRAEVDEADIVSWLGGDPLTKVIACYSEGMTNGRKFMNAAKKTIETHKKPIVIYKSGRSKQSALAAQSHTGSYGGTYGVYLGAFHQAGVLDTDSYDELLATSKALSLQPPAKGAKVSLISNGAGPMVNALDMFDSFNLELAEISKESKEFMRDKYPVIYTYENPIDVTGSATSNDYKIALETMGKDENVDIILCWFVFQDTPLDEGILDVLKAYNDKYEKPLLCGARGGPYTKKMRANIERNGVPIFESAQMWLKAAVSLVRWGGFYHEITKK